MQVIIVCAIAIQSVSEIRKREMMVTEEDLDNIGP